MPLTDNRGTLVHYEVEGEGEPLVLYHGTTHNWEQWGHLGFSKGLDGFRLIMLDARGHGESGKPHDADAYSPANLASDVVAVLDDLGIGRAHYFGYSYGGFVGFCLAKYAQERFATLTIGGMHPYARDPDRYDAQVSLLQQGMDAWVANVERNGGFRFPEDRDVVRGCDPQALIALSLAMK